MKVSRHAIKRWRERIEDLGDDQEIESRIREVMAEAEAICNTDDGATVYLHETIILIANGEHVLTVYRPEYGFGAEIDRSIAEALIRRLKEVRAKRAALRREVEEHLRAIEAALQAAQNELSILQTRIERLKAEREATLAAEREVAREEDGLARRLYQSIHYRLELMAGKRHAQAG